MTTQEIFEKLVNEIHTTVIAANDSDGNPVTSVIDMMLTENEALCLICPANRYIGKISPLAMRKQRNMVSL